MAEITRLIEAITTLTLINILPKFDPDVQDVDDWLLIVAQLTRQTADATIVQLLPTILKGNALSWYVTQIRTGNFPASWPTWKDAITKAFSRSQLAAFNDLLSHVQQINDNPIGFYHDTLYLCTRYNSNMADEEKLKYLIRGFLADLKEKIIIMAPATTADLLEKLHVLQSITVTTPSPSTTEARIIQDMLVALTTNTQIPHRTVVSTTPARVTKPPFDDLRLLRCQLRDMRDGLDDFRTNLHRQNRSPLRDRCNNTNRAQYRGFVFQLKTTANGAQDLSQYDIRSLQREDAYMAPVIKILEDKRSLATRKHRRLADFFRMRNGLLQRRLKTDNGFLLAVVAPTSMRHVILRAFHKNVPEGHFNLQQTWKTIRQQFWWPKMLAQIDMYVNSCIHCQQQ